MRESARVNIRTEGGRTAEEVEEEVLKMLPLRDFDDEELDEQGSKLKLNAPCCFFHPLHLSSVFTMSSVSSMANAPKHIF